MKYALSITILSTLISVASFNATAYAGEGMSARFSFAPNVWGGGVKSAGTPEPPIVKRKPAWHPTAVAHMAPTVPHDNSFLGLDNDALAARAPKLAPIATTQVAVVPTYAQMLPAMSAKPVTGDFKSVFGKPISAEPVKAPAPQIAVAHSLPLAIPSVNAKLVSNPVKRYHNARPMIAHAKSLKSSGDSYGQNFGYIPGAGLSSGDGLSTSTQVHAQLVRH